MFRGINIINLDPKGRMAMPARYRARLQGAIVSGGGNSRGGRSSGDGSGGGAGASGQLILTIDTHEPCLLLYPLNEWEVIEQKIEALPSFHPVTRRIQRLLIGHATELELDSSGRILLPPLLRDYAKLDKQVMMIGQGKKFEIWSDTNWQAGRDSWIEKTSQKEEKETLPPELQSFSL